LDPNILPFVVRDRRKVKLLRDRGAVTDRKALTAAATYRDSAAAVRLLIEHGAKPSREALLMASLSGGVDFASLLLASGADPNEKAEYGESPLFISILSDNTGLVHLLVAA